MTCIKTGAIVHDVPHGTVFMADLFAVAGAIVVRANGPIEIGKNAEFFGEWKYRPPTHELHDGQGGFWREDLGTFVVDARQIRPV